VAREIGPYEQNDGKLRLEILVTTENNQPENNDVQVSVAEQTHASETPATPSSSEVATSPEENVIETQTDLPETAHLEQQEGNDPVLNGGTQDPEYHPGPIDTAFPESVNESAPVTPAAQIIAEEMLTFAYPDQGALKDEDVVRPFTDFIEEFRQTEVGFDSMLQEQTAEAFSSFSPVVEQGTGLPVPPSAAITGTDEAAAMQEESQVPAEEEKPATSKERPVSPLLRPATRGRMPRHGGGRHREDVAATANKSASRADKTQASGREEGEAEPASPIAASTASTEAAPSTESTPAGEVPAASMPQAELASTEEQPKPARRYRFDRPVPASPVVPVQPVQQVRTEESKENRVTTSTPTHSDSGQQFEREAQFAQQPTKQNGSATSYTGQQTPKSAPSQEPASTNGGGTAAATPSSPSTRDRRRHSQERQHEKEKGQPTAAPLTAADATPVAEVTEPAAAPVEIPPEDLPPLEYSELQAATSRRRRRRRTTPAGSPTTAVTSNTQTTAKVTTPEQSPAGSTTAPSPVPVSPAAVPRNVAVPGTPASAGQYNIVSGYTVSQMNQGNDGTGPFMGPEPSPARGSNTLREPRIRSEAQRPSSFAARHGEPTATPVSINQLATVISQSFQSQTDRMIAELRRANQVPTNVSVSFPPFPSTERVGVFVDVANLLYSARTQRLTIDFGKLLDFLRGNRRLVRAQAYCPTSPQPGDEQMFLQAVKGLGYRITTKNYKTFSSGAKKADLDLDLCMDVVRLVDGSAVDCVVLVSGDSDFMPMLDYCSDHGVRVEVAAFDESMSATLRQSCDLFINLSMLEEIRA
jgi:uncharacterized LabA/DUF88 family protein